MITPTPPPEAARPTPETDAADFCQWCYDKGLRYSRGPWLHGVGCPFAPQKPEAKTVKEVLEIASIEDRYLPLLRIATKAEMERDALRVALADAPHEGSCECLIEYGPHLPPFGYRACKPDLEIPCTCWKARAVTKKP